jgi:hypothetical protein
MSPGNRDAAPESWEVVEGGAAHGLDAVRQLFAEYTDAFGQHVEIEDEIEPVSESSRALAATSEAITRGWRVSFGSAR